MHIQEEDKIEILNNSKSNNDIKSIEILKRKYSFKLNECLEIIDKIKKENIPRTQGDKNDIIKKELKAFFDNNTDYLSLNLPFAKWDTNSVLFSTNDTIKGKIFFKMGLVDFKLKHKFWAPYSLNASRNYESPHWFNTSLEIIQNGEFLFPIDSNGEIIYKRISEFAKKLKELLAEYDLQKINLENARLKLIEEERLLKLDFHKKNALTNLDKDGNGQVDLIDGESFNRLLNKNQKTIIEIDKNYIQKFVKISIYLKTKRKNTQTIFESIRDTVNEEELNELVSLLKNQIHTYELLVFHSISMITSLVQGDLITFYEIYECFDQLSVFNSNWENEISNKLTDIGDGIKELMYAIYEMENRLVDSIENLTYITQDSFGDLTKSVNLQLAEINTSLDINNLLTGIQTYQMYRINQNTKRLN